MLYKFCSNIAEQNAQGCSQQAQIWSASGGTGIKGAVILCAKARKGYFSVSSAPKVHQTVTMLQRTRSSLMLLRL